MLRTETQERPADVLSLNILSNRGRTIRPKTLNQKRYVDAIDKHTVVFGIGPAGTGKTYLAMAKAVQALQAKQVNRIILTRPAVEAGERLGFLPGTLSEKIDPYLRPLYDALHDMLDPETIPKLLTAGTIEVAPLAYMRGRTPQRRVHHPRRGAEHLARADEDVPDPARVRLEDGRHRRRHPGRPARRHAGPGCGSSATSSTASRTSTSRCLTAHDVVRHRLVGRDRRGVRDATRSSRGRAGDAQGRARPASIERAADERRGAQRVRRRRSTSTTFARGWPVRAATGCGCTPRPSCACGSSTRPPSRSSTSSGWTSRRPDRRAGLPDGRADARAATASRRPAGGLPRRPRCCARRYAARQAAEHDHTVDDEIACC